MNELAQYLNEVKNKKGIKSDRQLAFRLGITPGFISRIYAGEKNASDELCETIAKLAGDKPENVILIAHKSKASEKIKPYWENIFKTLAAATFAAVIALPYLFNVVDGRYIMSTFILLTILTLRYKANLPKLTF